MPRTYTTNYVGQDISARAEFEQITALFTQLSDDYILLDTSNDPFTGILTGPTFNATDRETIMQLDGVTFIHTGEENTVDNLFIGENAGNNTNTDDQNTGIGSNALASLTSGRNNFCLGFDAGTKIEDGVTNTCIGSQAGEELVSGSNNFFMGLTSGSRTVTGASNTYIGTSSGKQNVGTDNIAIGSEAFNGTANETDTRDNVIIGQHAGFAERLGGRQVIIGKNAMDLHADTGANAYNVIIGMGAVRKNLTGKRNVIIGGLTGNLSSTGSPHNVSDNTIIGYNAGSGMTNGGSNVIIGRDAGDDITTGDRNIVLGRDKEVASAVDDNQLSIHNIIFGTGCSGVGTPDDTANYAGLIGIGEVAPDARLHVKIQDAEAVPVLKLEQLDLSEEMVDFSTTVGVGNPIEAIAAKVYTTTHLIKVTLPGPTTLFMPCGTLV